MSCQNGFPICKFAIRKHKFIYYSIIYVEVVVVVVVVICPLFFSLFTSQWVCLYYFFAFNILRTLAMALKCWKGEMSTPIALTLISTHSSNAILWTNKRIHSQSNAERCDDDDYHDDDDDNKNNDNNA